MKWMTIFLPLLVTGTLLAQSSASLMSEGNNLEQMFKEEEAIEKYKQAASLQNSNQQALIKCAELSCTIGGRKSSIVDKMVCYPQAKKFAEAALKLDSNNAEANYIMAVVYGKLTEVENTNDDLVHDLKNIKAFAEKAIELNPQMGRAFHILGRWHLELASLNMIKKTALKVLYPDAGDASIEFAISNMEKCKAIEPNFCLNFYDLARAYLYNKQQDRAKTELEHLSTLSPKRQSDPIYMTQGAGLLQRLQ